MEKRVGVNEPKAVGRLLGSRRPPWERASGIGIAKNQKLGCVGLVMDVPAKNGQRVPWDRLLAAGAQDVAKAAKEGPLRRNPPVLEWGRLMGTLLVSWLCVPAKLVRA